MRIGEKTFKKVSEQVLGLMLESEGKINQAFLRSEDDFAISFKAKIKPNGNGTKIETKISFTVEKFEDTSTGTVSEIQASLFAENIHDKRTRLHTLWMSEGGEKVKGGFVGWYRLQ